MRQLSDLAQERDTMATVLELTGAFEGIASMHISQIRDRVLASQKFFGELWNIYKQIRVDKQFHFGRHRAITNNKDLLILVTAEGSFSGDIDERVVASAVTNFDTSTQEIVVVGTHGAAQLAQTHIPYVRSFRLPISDIAINVAPLVGLVQLYKSTTIFYPAYISLSNQEVKSIQMSAWVDERGKNVTAAADDISERSYIFEPSTHAVVDHLERSMINIMLGEIIMESKLAQYASRFAAMHAARDKADDSLSGLKNNYNHAKRRLKDERAKEIINGMRKAAL